MKRACKYLYIKENDYKMHGPNKGALHASILNLNNKQMKKFILIVILLPMLFISYSCKGTITEPELPYNDTSVVAYKPNIYIYPKERINLTVEIIFPSGGEVIESIPLYNNLWEIVVAPSGKINDTLNYLFYECKMPNFTQKQFGWVIEKENLKEFFVTNMTTSGFNKNEINDFIEYWIPILTEYKYYEIYPQYKSTLDKMVKIKYSIEPTDFYRLFYFVRGRDNNQIELETPMIESAKRENYYALEWGVIL